MHRITMYLDFVSPYAWLAFQQLPNTLEGLSYQVQYRPVWLGALMQHHRNPAAVGVAPKRVWTYQHAQWLAQHLGTPIQLPAAHPFNSLPLLRLALQTSGDGTINRYVAETLFRHVWEGGGDALSSERIAQLHIPLQQLLALDSTSAERAKQLLRSNTDAALAADVFGVPAFEVDGRMFWGIDSLPMLRDYLNGHPWFEGTQWSDAQALPSGMN